MHRRNDSIIFRGVPRFLGLDMIEAAVEKNGIEFTQSAVGLDSVDLGQVEQAEVTGGEKFTNGWKLVVGCLADDGIGFRQHLLAAAQRRELAALEIELQQKWRLEREPLHKSIECQCWHLDGRAWAIV